jgi:hypothetical protein
MKTNKERNEFTVLACFQAAARIPFRPPIHWAFAQLLPPGQFDALASSPADCRRIDCGTPTLGLRRW